MVRTRDDGLNIFCAKGPERLAAKISPYHGLFSSLKCPPTKAYLLQGKQAMYAGQLALYNTVDSCNS